MMARDSARAFYGPGHVQAAHELGAVQTLLITDTLFRVNDVAQVHCLAFCICFELVWLFFGPTQNLQIYAQQTLHAWHA